MRQIINKVLYGILVGALLAGCGVQMGDDSARTPVTGSTGGATAQNANSKLERCDQSLGSNAIGPIVAQHPSQSRQRVAHIPGAE